MLSGEAGELGLQPPHELEPLAAQPASFVISYNVSKKHNIGTIARCCTAFGVRQVSEGSGRWSAMRATGRTLLCTMWLWPQMCLVGSNQFNAFGSHGADAHVDMRCGAVRCGARAAKNASADRVTCAKRLKDCLNCL
jgi:hypothetical protein